MHGNVKPETLWQPGLAYELRRLLDDEPIDALIFAGLLMALAWVPLWLGSNRLLPWGLNAVLFGGLTMAYEIALLLRGRNHPVGIKVLMVPVALFAIVIAWIYVQMSTLAPVSLHHPIWPIASDVLNNHLAGTISVDCDLTFLALLRLLTCAAVLWLSIQLCRDRFRAQLMLRAVSIIVAAYAIYGLIAYALFSSAILWFGAADAQGYVRSTFVNRNSFATYAGLGLVATLGCLLRLYRHEMPETSGSLAHRISIFIETTGRQGVILIGTGLIILVALLATGSRGGISATALGLIALFLLTFARRKRRATEQIEAILFVSLALVAGFFFFGDTFAGRIAAEGFTDVSRMAVYTITLQSILSSPILGFGYGTFVDVFPLYRDRSVSVDGIWDHAHNSYLEVWQGLGLLFGTMLMVAIGWLLYLCLKGALNRRQNAMPAIVASSACLLVAAHAVVDFSLEIEAVALTFMALLGAGVAQSMSSNRIVSD